LAWHKGRLYASFGENTSSEEARGRASDDRGETWGEVFTIDAGEGDLAVSHGVFLSHAGTLWAFHGAYSGMMRRVHTRAYVLDDSAGRWSTKGVVVEAGFWPMQEPQRMEDGKRILNIARYREDTRPLVAASEDFGRTWSPSRPANMPMVGSKPCAGALSTGQHYLICTTAADSGHRRSPLTLALSQPGEMAFSRVFVIRRAVFPDGPGESHPGAALAYPCAIEHGSKLYVGYSNSGGRRGKERLHWNNNSAELAVIPLASL